MKSLLKYNNPNKMWFSLFAVLGIIFLISIYFYGNQQSKDIGEVKESVAISLPASIKEYTSTYITRGENTLNKENDHVPNILAMAITKDVLSNMNSSILTSSQIKKLIKNVSATVDSQIQAMGIKLTLEEHKMLSAGIEALVISNVYKAIADKGLISMSNLDTVRESIEERLSVYEECLSTQTNDISGFMDDLLKLLADADTEVLDMSGKLSSLSGDLIALEEKVDTLKSLEDRNLSDLLKQKDREELEAMLKEVSIKLSNSFLQQNSSLVELRITIDEVLNTLENDVSTDFSSLSKALESAKLSFEEELADQSKFMKNINDSLNSLTEDFLINLDIYHTTQANTDVILAQVVKNLGEGSVDERLINLCNELAQALGADIISSNQELSSKLDILDNVFTDTTVSLETNISSLTGEMYNKFATLDGNISSLTEEQTRALTDTAASLQSQIDSSNLEITNSLTAAQSSLSSLIEGNTENIAELLSNLNSTKSELENQISAADSETKENLTNAVTEINNVIISLNSSFGSQIGEAKELLSENIASLQSELNDTAATLTQTKTALDVAKETLSSQLSDLSNSLKAANESILQLESDVTSAETQIDSNSSAIGELGTSKADVSEVNNLANTVNSNITAIKNVDGKVDTNASTIKNVEGKADANTSAISGLNSSKASASSVTDLTNKVNGLDTSKANTSSVTDLTKKVDGLDTKKADKSIVTSISDRVSDLENDVTMKAEMKLTYKDGIPTLTISNVTR